MRRDRRTTRAAVEGKSQSYGTSDGAGAGAGARDPGEDSQSSKEPDAIIDVL